MGVVAGVVAIGGTASVLLMRHKSDPTARAANEFDKWIGNALANHSYARCWNDTVDDSKVMHVCLLMGVQGDPRVAITYDPRTETTDSAVLLLRPSILQDPDSQRVIDAYLTKVAPEVETTATVTGRIGDGVVMLGASMQLCFSGKLRAHHGYEQKFGHQTVTGECDEGSTKFYIWVRPPVGRDASPTSNTSVAASTGSGTPWGNGSGAAHAAVQPSSTSPETPSPLKAPVALSLDTVQQLVKAQAASLTSTSAAFVDSFDARAIAFFSHSLTLYEGRDKIVDGSREAWARRGAPDHVDASDVVVGLLPHLAWATAQWKITLGGTKTVLPVRVTEVIAQDVTGLRVLAASFSVPSTTSTSGIGEPVPALAGGVTPSPDSDIWLTSPKELAGHVRNDDATTLIGSDVKEFALGADESRKMLAGWKNVKLEFVGNVRAIEGAGYRIVVAYARWRGPKPTLFRVFALFVPGEAMVGPAPWELATAQYSVAVPASGPQIATAVATTPESTCTIAALACDRFSTNGQTGKKLHALVFAAEQAGHHAAAICLAQSNLTSSDKWLAGAANFDTSRAWDGLGCHTQAIAAIEASLAVRPHDQGGWKETCDQCRKIGGACAACDDSPRLARSNSTAATVDRGETGSNTSDPPPMWVSLVQDPPRVFEVWEAGKKVMDGPGGLQVVPGHPRTIVIKGQGWKDKTLVVDGRNERVEFKLELAPDCKSTLADPESVDCRGQFCEGHADDARCHSE